MVEISDYCMYVRMEAWNPEQPVDSASVLELAEYEMPLFGKLNIWIKKTRFFRWNEVGGVTRLTFKAGLAHIVAHGTTSFWVRVSGRLCIIPDDAEGPLSVSDVGRQYLAPPLFCIDAEMIVFLPKDIQKYHSIEGKRIVHAVDNELRRLRGQ